MLFSLPVLTISGGQPSKNAHRFLKNVYLQVTFIFSFFMPQIPIEISALLDFWMIKDVSFLFSSNECQRQQNEICMQHYLRYMCMFIYLNN